MLHVHEFDYSQSNNYLIWKPIAQRFWSILIESADQNLCQTKFEHCICGTNHRNHKRTCIPGEKLLSATMYSVCHNKTLLSNCLTLPAPIPDEEKKLTKIFIFLLLCGVSKGFMMALKAFIKLFEVPQRSVKIRI